MSLPNTPLVTKRAAAIRLLRDCRSVVVALSGGVDSAVLLALAVEALGPARVLAATGDSPSLARTDLDHARAVAASLGVDHVVLATDEMAREGYRANAGNRCFHCRLELFERLERLALDRGLERLAYGAIVDDLGDLRPGMRAATRHRVAAPLLDAGLGKSEIRRLARELGLAVRDKPAGACLASRIPTGTRVTGERLARVERSENSLRGLGFGQFRVRHHGRLARLELDAVGRRRMEDPGTRRRVVAVLRASGFEEITVDPDGYRPGGVDAPRIDPENPEKRGKRTGQ